MPARCLGSTPPPISRPREGGEDARHKPASTGREIDLTAMRPTPFSAGRERTIPAARTAQDLIG
jgi:hypothetical protein